MATAKSKRNPLDEGCELHEQATETYQAGDTDAALRLFNQALELFEQTEGADSLNAAATRHALGTIHEDRSQYAAAARQYERAAAIVEPIEDTTEEAVAELQIEAIRNLARLRRIEGRFAEAEPLMLRALALTETLYGTGSDQAAWRCNDLGMLGKFSGRFADADEWYARALRILTANHGTDDPILATLYHNLGGLEHARGRFAEGEVFARKSVELRERVSESDDPALAADLAALLDGQEKFDESEPLYLHALAIFRRAHGEEHYEIAVNLHNLAGVYQAQERLAEAETHYLRALAVKEKIFPSDNVEIALTLNNLGALYQTLSRDDEAAPLLQRALAIFEQSLEAGHPHLIACRENYAAFSS